jgi:hypothetical protein
MSAVPILRTERLVLRGLESGDTDAVIRVFADPEMSRFFVADFSDPVQLGRWSSGDWPTTALKAWAIG